MSTDRRRFLTTIAAAGGVLELGLTSPLAALTELNETPTRSSTSPPGRALNILILGGTNLTGPHNVRYALERGHSVTIFNRGRTQPGLFQDAFEQVEHLTGDRADDLEALRGRQWDAVIDASGMEVEWTRDSAQLLRDAAETYLYISSTGVFYPYLTTNITEDTAPVLEDPSNGENIAARYGVMKALSELEAKKAFPGRTIIARAGYIVGPLDRTQRGTYWPERIRRGGEVMVPGRRSDQVQQIDVRDLTEWMIRAIENKTYGTFNITGPTSRPTTMEEFVYAVRGAFSSDLTWTWIEDYEFLEANEVFFAIPWIIATGDNLGSQTINVDRAIAAGLTFRPMAETAVDTMEWYDSLPDDDRTSMIISREKEAEVLAAWKSRSG